MIGMELFFMKYKNLYQNSECRIHTLNGKIHREDGPAIIYEDESEKYYINGELHRDNGPASIVKCSRHFKGSDLYPQEFKNDFILFFYKNGLFHNDSGPAIVYPWGENEYYINGLKHRTDGPAHTYEDGSYRVWVCGLRTLIPGFF